MTLGRSLGWIHPNVLTIIGIIPQVLFFFFLQNHHYLPALLALLATPLDLLDGLVARVNNKVTAFGGFLDSTLDRVADFLLLAGLYVGGLISLPLTAFLVITTFLISYTRSRGELASHARLAFNVGLIERPERIGLIFLIIAAQLVWPAIISSLAWLWLILSLYTVLQRVWFAYRNL